MLEVISPFLSAPRHHKRIITLSYDVIATTFALYAAIALRLNTWLFQVGIDEIVTIAATVILTIISFTKLGMYRAVLRYMMMPALGNIFIAVAISAFGLAIASFLTHSFIPRSVPAIYSGLAIIMLGGPRILIRVYFSQNYKKNKPNVVIYGAGATGRDLANALLQGNQYHPIAFIDDDPAKQNSIIYGLRVHREDDFNHLLNLYEPVKLLLAINNIGKGDRLRLVKKLEQLPIQIQSVPSVEDIACGKANIDQLKDLDLNDLLGRDPIPPEPELMSKNINGKSVMVTGAGGSIGSELCRQIIKQKPRTLVLFELNEFNLYSVEQELVKLNNNTDHKVEIIAALGSVQRQNRLEKIMTGFQVDTVYHAAAYKHVPMVEHNMVEGIRNNIFGTWFTAEAAIKCNVKNFVLISTDKAVRPTNVMGASKRMAELVLQALAERQLKTNFTMVRFGNVLGSSGSVVPLFRKQIKDGGPVTVTHPDIIRYFMLIPEAAQLVIQAGAMGNSGQVFVLDMGEQVKISELAKKIIHLMGYSEKNDSNPDGDIEIIYTGLRPGEKLFEELLIGENVEGTTHSKIMTAAEAKLTWEAMSSILKRLDIACHDFDIEMVRNILLDVPTGYQPNSEIKDWLYRENIALASNTKITH
ncbi:polysaccharide biosynthesis protein [Photobacterium lipolyticum]|uniref:Nucleoside-diphosphate sugar epimerase n=1 Tax=Photobacterium lipolyticum TaxID=266810 RepID=A0A2T3MVB0_9GAMM|nr:nucleoside-diphosphate sugar epimerase/dehydratase [Photobacterium lipolyticum]PSW03905.1 nucleoside-diphosphate sugar epimerase [Photobacterium lipolyticum]